MSSLTKIIATLFRWAFYLASIGGLAHATMSIAHEAAHQTETGLVSLGKLNRQLNGVRHHHPDTSNDISSNSS